MTKLIACKKLNEDIKNLITQDASHDELRTVCEKYLNSGDLSQKEVYSLILLHSQSSIIENAMEEKLLDLLELYTGYWATESESI